MSGGSADHAVDTQRPSALRPKHFYSGVSEEAAAIRSSEVAFGEVSSHAVSSHIHMALTSPLSALSELRLRSDKPDLGVKV